MRFIYPESTRNRYSIVLPNKWNFGLDYFYLLAVVILAYACTSRRNGSLLQLQLFPFRLSNNVQAYVHTTSKDIEHGFVIKISKESSIRTRWQQMTTKEILSTQLDSITCPCLCVLFSWSNSINRPIAPSWSCGIIFIKQAIISNASFFEKQQTCRSFTDNTATITCVTGQNNSPDWSMLVEHR